MSGARHWEQDKDSTLYIGNLDERCTDSLVWELMLQAGPIINVHLPKDRVTQIHQGYGFVEFGSEEDADYAAKIMNQIRIWGKPIRVNKASADKRGEGGVLGGGQGVGAELFVGNLDAMVDEKVLFETFSRFGPLISPPKVARDDNNLSKGYGFISYASFEASDDAIANMHGQFLSNKEITVQYAYKKDGKAERHGDAAERALAAQAKAHGVAVSIPAMPASLVMPSGTPSTPSSMQPNGYSNGMGAPPMRAPQPPPAYNYGAYPPMQAAYSPMAPPGGLNGMGPPSRGYNAAPLMAPPMGAGLPARPPPSMAGYGGPQHGPGMQTPISGAMAPPPGFMPPGAPPGLPPGMPPVGYGPPAGYQPPPQR